MDHEDRLRATYAAFNARYTRSPAISTETCSRRGRLRHVYGFREGLVARMDVEGG